MTAFFYILAFWLTFTWDVHMQACDCAQKGQQLYMKHDRQWILQGRPAVYFMYCALHTLHLHAPPQDTWVQLLPYPVFPGSCLNQQAKLKPFGAANPLNEAAGMKIEEFEEISAEERVEPGRLGPVNVAWPMLSRSSCVGGDTPNGQVPLHEVSKQFGANDAEVSAVKAQNVSAPSLPHSESDRMGLIKATSKALGNSPCACVVWRKSRNTTTMLHALLQSMMAKLGHLLWKKHYNSSNGHPQSPVTGKRQLILQCPSFPRWRFRAYTPPFSADGRVPRPRRRMRALLWNCHKQAHEYSYSKYIRSCSHSRYRFCTNVVDGLHYWINYRSWSLCGQNSKPQRTNSLDGIRGPAIHCDHCEDPVAAQRTVCSCIEEVI